MKYYMSRALAQKLLSTSSFKALSPDRYESYATQFGCMEDVIEMAPEDKTTFLEAMLEFYGGRPHE